MLKIGLALILSFSLQLLSAEEFKVPLELGVPSHFVTKNPHGEPSLDQWTYLGADDTLHEYFTDENNLSEAIIRMKISDISQNEIEDPEARETIKERYAALGYRNFKDLELNWGGHPLYAIAGDHEATRVFIAWVGLNNDSNQTMIFQMIYPADHFNPSDEDKDLWRQFLITSKEAPQKEEKEPIKPVEQPKAIVPEQEMQQGYTMVNFGGSKMKVVAEQREEDDKLLIVIVPLADDINFKLEKAEKDKGEPTAKVIGTLTKENSKQDIDAILVIVKKVPEFSLDLIKMKMNPRVTVYQTH